MPASNKVSVNFSGGEVSPELIARTDIPLFNRILSRSQNFVVQTQGPLKFRQGSLFVHWTRLNRKAVFIPFQFSDIQAYLIEATDRYFRFYKDGGLVLESSKTITGLTDASPGVFTSVAHGYATGDEIFLSGITDGPTELNGKYYWVVRLSADTYSLKDQDGDDIDTALYDTWVAGGITERVFEMPTPYLEADLEDLQYTQSADVMYIASQKYAPRKLTRVSDTSWTLAKYTRTADPFTGTKTITGITKANPAVVTSNAHGYSNGNIVWIEGVVGMTEVNGKWYKLAGVTTNTYNLQTLDSVNVDSTGYTTYSSAGTSELYAARKYPRAVSFTDDARLVWGGTLDNPETLWFSRSPDTNGAVRYDDYTTGTDATHALVFTLATLKGKVDAIRWITSTDKYIAVGTFSSVRRVYGATEAEPITPTSATAKPANSDGVALARPITDGATLMYIQRGARKLESLEYDYTIDGYAPDDKNLVTGHLTKPAAMKQVVRQITSPNLIWVIRTDGVLLGLTHKAKENVAGWHRHYMGGDGAIEYLGVMPRETQGEQLWMIVKRTIGGETKRYVEFLSDEPVFPDRADFYADTTSEEEEDSDRYTFALFEKQKQAIHVDAASTYDGSLYGSLANATLTVPWGSHLLDNSVTFVTDQDVFTEDMVGRQIWGGYDSEGLGGGRADITGFTDAKTVTVSIVAEFPFETDYIYAPGVWYITATTVSGLDYLEGETVMLITDGAIPDSAVVQNGSVEIDVPASVIHAGLGYTGIIKTLPLDQGGVSGPAQNKLKSVDKVQFRLLNTGAFMFGASLYALTAMEFSYGNQFLGMPVPLFSGLDGKFYEDSWAEDKTMYMVQNYPLPCTIAAIDIYGDTTDE